jgi:hypothetical protein
VKWSTHDSFDGSEEAVVEAEYKGWSGLIGRRRRVKDDSWRDDLENGRRTVGWSRMFGEISELRGEGGDVGMTYGRNEVEDEIKAFREDPVEDGIYCVLNKD